MTPSADPVDEQTKLHRIDSLRQLAACFRTPTPDQTRASSCFLILSLMRLMAAGWPSNRASDIALPPGPPRTQLPELPGLPGPTRAALLFPHSRSRAFASLVLGKRNYRGEVKRRLNRRSVALRELSVLCVMMRVTWGRHRRGSAPMSISPHWLARTAGLGQFRKYSRIGSCSINSRSWG